MPDPPADATHAVVQLVRENKLYHARSHSDAEAIEAGQFRQDPGARILWAHSGCRGGPEKVREMLRTCTATSGAQPGNPASKHAARVPRSDSGMALGTSSSARKGSWSAATRGDAGDAAIALRTSNRRAGAKPVAEQTCRARRPLASRVKMRPINVRMDVWFRSFENP